MKIYTRAGDEGQTGLLHGERVLKIQFFQKLMELLTKLKQYWDWLEQNVVTTRI